MTPNVPRMLRSEEAARRLGVQLPTLYAYVSRGLLTSHRSPDGRRSLFDESEVESLARRSRGARQTETRLATITTSVTRIGEKGPEYRGIPAVDLAGVGTQNSPGPWRVPLGEGRFEEVASVLWAVPDQPDQPAKLRFMPTIVPAPPVGMAGHDVLRWAVVVCGATNSLRSDLRRDAISKDGAHLLATMVDVLFIAAHGSTRPNRSNSCIAAGLADGLRALPTTSQRQSRRVNSTPTPGVAAAIDAALVLLADHELATSTLAVRVAASTRADLYDCMLAGLGALGGPLHGGASDLAHEMLVDAGLRGAEPALGTAIRRHGFAPGFGHSLYPPESGGDPRATALFSALEQIGEAKHLLTVREVLDAARSQRFDPPNIDLALAALSYSAGLDPGAGQIIFTVARTAGWVAHMMEELDEKPLRFRARAVYAAP